MKALMKKITDSEPKARVFVNPKTGKTEVFKGAIIIMTNKDPDKISSENEDAKAIMSRCLVNNMQFTRAESMELINRRWKTMKLSDYQKAFEAQFPKKEDQIKVRRIVKDWLNENVADADPGKFTPRTFIQIMSMVGPKIANGNKVKTVSGSVQIGTTVPWQSQALNIIKGLDDEFNEEERIKIKKELLKKKKELEKNDKKRYNIIFGERGIDAFLGSPDDEEDDKEEKTEKVKKSMDVGFGMSLEEAEEILLG